MSATVLVTGGAGFIGSHVARRLAERGDRVVCLDQQPPSGEAEWWLEPVARQVSFVRADVSQWPDVMAAVEQHRPAAIVHTAAIGDPAAVQYRPLQAMRINVEGSLNCLEAARIFGLRRIVLFSSIGILPGIRYQPIDTSHPVICSDEGPGSGFYGASKVAVEAFAYGYRQSFGVDFIVVRPSAVYGFGMRHPIFIKPMVENAILGRPTRFSHGREFPRDYTHVADVVQLTTLAVDAPADGIRDRVYYAATGGALRTAGDAVQIVRSLVPDADIAIGQGFSESDQLELRYRGILSIQNAREQLGYEPKFARLEDGLPEYIRIYRSYLEAHPEAPTWMNPPVFESHFSLAGKAALVTGASGGIGRALAVGLAGAGADLVVHGRSPDQLAETARAVGALERRCVILSADLARPGACQNLIADAAAALGRLDVLVNCAGMNRRMPIDQVSGDDYDAIMQVNLRAVFFLSRAAREVMRPHGGGKIIHVASLTSTIALGGTSVYGMSKAALTQLAKTQAVEWAADNIQVNCLAPGFILTPLTEGPLWGDPKRRSWLLGRIPARRPGLPEEMVGVVLLLAGPGSSYLTGQTITVDGGVLAGGSWDD